MPKWKGRDATRRYIEEHQASTDWPDGMEMIRQLRVAVGLFAGAMPVTPEVAWKEALLEVRRLRASQSPEPRCECGWVTGNHYHDQRMGGDR